jgi:hypothetical protein
MYVFLMASMLHVPNLTGNSATLTLSTSKKKQNVLLGDADVWVFPKAKTN